MAKKRVKFIKVKYFECDKSYTYKTDILEVAVGDFVVVPTPRGNTVAKVVSAKVHKPEYVCKLVEQKIDL